MDSRRAGGVRWLLYLAVVVCSGAWAQQADMAVIVGAVTDGSGAVIPAVPIELTHLSTGTAYVAETDLSGYYRTPPLRIGEFMLEVEAPGFKRIERRGVVVNVGDFRRVDFKLEVGEVTTTLEVTAQAPLLQTHEAAAGTLMTNEQIRDLPLNGRDYLQLARISAGVAPPAGAEFFEQAQGVSVGGSQASQVNFLIDGVDNNNQSIASQGGQKESLKPQVDSIAEFKIVTNAYSAEYGRSMGGVVTVTTRSGTNEFHGTAFEFLRNEKLDARNYFARPDQDKPPFKRNQYGFSLGGPIKKNKAFFFGDLELGDIRETAFRVFTIPTPAMRAGDFSAARDIIHDPMTLSPESETREPFANQVIPDSRIDRVSRITRNWWPTPTNSRPNNNYSFNPPATQDTRRWGARYDQNVTDKQSLYVRFSAQDKIRPRSPDFPDNPDAFYLPGVDAAEIHRHTTFVYNKVWGPRVVGSFRAGWNYTQTDREHVDPEPLNPRIGLDMGHGLDRGAAGGAGFILTDWRNVNTGFFNHIGSQTRQVAGDLTITAGRHTVKVGHTTYWLQSQIFNPALVRGFFNFDGRFTDQSRGARAGDSLADMLLGLPFRGATSSFRHMALRAPFFQQYVQDDWRVSDRLTVNLGLRYSVNLPWLDVYDTITNMDVDTDPNNARFVRPTDSPDGRRLIATDTNNFAPRLGLAYRFGDNTVIRAGGGLFYANIMNLGGGEFIENNPPRHVAVARITDFFTPLIRLQDGYGPDPLAPENVPPIVSSSLEPNPIWPVAAQWNLNIQRQLPNNVLWEIGYFGSKGTHITRRDDLNFARPGPGAPNSRRRWQTTLFPGTDVEVPLGRMFSFRNDANSIYHGLQTRLEKRLSDGLSFLVTYAWSRAIGDYSRIPGEFTNNRSESQNPLDRKAERALLDHHVAHRLVTSFLYELPFGKGRKFAANMPKAVDAVLGGWTVGGITTLMSGVPLSAYSRRNNSGTGLNTDRPNIIGDWELPRSQRSPEAWWSVSAFEQNRQFQFGSLGRNALQAPGTAKLDLAIHKNFVVREQLRIQLRAEAFNAFNHPLFLLRNVLVGAPNFATISQAAPGRVMQFGLKLIW